MGCSRPIISAWPPPSWIPDVPYADSAATAARWATSRAVGAWAFVSGDLDDGTLDALNSIKDEKLTATLSTNPHEMGRILLRTMVRGLIKEEKIFEEILSPINIVDLENVSYHL